MPDIPVFAASVIASTFASHARGKTMGVLGENLPEFDLSAFVTELRGAHGSPFRLAVLGSKAKPIKSSNGVEVTTSAKIANTWRNDAATREGKKLFAIVLGVVTEGRLHSLNGKDRGVLVPVSDRDLRNVIRDKAISLLNTEKRKALWSYLARNDDAFTVDALLQFAAHSHHVATKSNAHDVVDSEARNLWMLGLIPHRKLLEASDKLVEKLVRPNLEMVARLKTLAKHDLRTLATISADNGESTDRKSVAKALLAFSRNNKRLQLLQHFDFDAVVRILTPKQARSATATGEPATRKERLLGDEAAVEDLIRTGGENLTAISDTFDTDRDEDDVSREEVKMDGRIVIKKSRVGTSQMSAAINRLITEDRFGGIVDGTAVADYVDCLKLLEAAEAPAIEFLPRDASDKYAVLTTLRRVVEFYGGSLTTDVLGVWERYDRARTAVLAYKHPLVDHPLLTLCSDEEALAACAELIAAYGALMDAVAYTRDVIRGQSNDTAKRLMSRALALDVIFLRYTGGAVAIAGPTHPFHLWRWVQIAKLLKEHREEFARLGDDLVQKHAANPPISSPHLLLTPYAEQLPRDYVFVGIGSIGSLPLYGDPESRTAAKFRADEIADIAKRFVSMSPHARHGFEVVLVDAPSLADVVDSLVSINNGRTRSDLVPIHVRSFRTREATSSTDEEEVEMEELAGVIREIRGSLELEPNRVNLDQIASKLAQRAAHLTLIFEPGDSQAFKVGIDISPTLSPLIVPRHYSYDQMEDQFHVIIHGDATPFGSYYSLFRDLLNLPEGNTIGRRSGASTWIPGIARIGENSMWFSVIDQGIEPTFNVPKAIRVDKRAMAGRDLHTFTTHQHTIRRYVEKVIAAGGLVPDDATVDRGFRLMQQLGGDTIPLVVSSASLQGHILPQQARGLLGSLAVTAWYQEQVPDGLLISLDSEVSRRWILGATENDGRRGDLLCLRQTTDGLLLEVIEVKARDDAQSGHAIGQIDATIAILKRVLAVNGSTAVDRARREILRDQLYMAVATRNVLPDKRQRAVQMLNEFFERGPSHIKGRHFLVHIESQATPSFPSTPERVLKSPNGNQIERFQITESEPTPPEDVPSSSSLLKAGVAQRLPLEKADDVAPTYEDTEGGARAASTPVHVPSPRQKNATIDVSSAELSESNPPLIVSLGRDPSGTKDVTWDTSANPNFGFLVTGDSGSGKSQTIRSIIHTARRLQYPVLVFDFKRDYADDPDKEDFFARDNKLLVYDVVNKGLPFNPLALIPNEAGIVQPVRQAYEIASIIQRIENLGQKQSNAFVEAMVRTYEKRGFKPKAKIRLEDATSAPPVFDDVIEELREADDSHSESVRIRLQKFSDLGLFPTEPASQSFEQMISSGAVLLMNDPANEKLMQVLAEIMIVKLHAVLKRGEQPRTFRRLVVLDEAWRVSKSDRLVELAREGRAFGVGLLIGTQNPNDMPDNLVSCLRTQLYLYNKDVENQKTIVRQLCNTTSGPDAQQRLQTLAHLQPFQGYLINQQYANGIRVNVRPYFQR